MKLFLWLLLCPAFSWAQDASTGTVAADSSAPSVSSPVYGAVSPSSAALQGDVPAADDSGGDGPWLACEVKVDGLINVKPKVVLKQALAKKGELYVKDSINKDIQALISLGNFSDASVDVTRIPGQDEGPGDTGPLACYRVTYIVQEKPLIKKISVEGHKKLSKSSVLDAMTLKDNDPYDEAKMREDIEKIKAKYREKGYIMAEAEFKTRPDAKPGYLQVTVAVQEGKQARVKEVVVNGVHGFKPKKIVKQTKNRPKKIFTEAELPQDKAEIEKFYKNKGYQDFRVEDSSVVFSADKSEVFITYWLNEGPKSKFGNTEFAGNTVISGNELMSALEYKKGKLYQQERFDDSVRAIQEKYADKGYLKAVVRSTETYNSATGELDIRFEVQENNIVYVDHVDVSGYKATKDYVLRREVVVKEGDIFRSSRIRKSQEKIMNLGFIDDVQIDIAPTADPDKVDLTFDVAEGKPGMLTAGAAVSSMEGLFGELTVQHLNLFGRAQKLALTWQFGARVLDYSISWTTPWVKDKPISLGFDLFNTRRLKAYGSSTSAYTEKRTGGRIRVGPRFEEDKYQLNLAYSYEEVTVTGVQTQYQNTLPEGTSITSSISAELAVDTRDNIWDPTRGCRHAVSFELTGGPLMGDLDIYKTGFSTSYNKKLFTLGDYPFVLAFANRFGIVGRYSDTPDVPVFERYFLGGPDTVRGYTIGGQVGPPNGGYTYYVFNTEFRFPLARERKRTIVQWAFFMDIGNSWSGMDTVQFQIGPEERQMKMGAGFGIRFTTPAFPIRLDWGYGFNHKPGESLSELYFTIGNLF